MNTPHLVEHYFRHEYGRLVAALSQRVGVEHVEAVEDAVQSALMAALETWTLRGRPEDPSAWLYRVAYNKLAGELRQGNRRRGILERNSNEGGTTSGDVAGAPLTGDVSNDLLRMLFVCCDETIPEPSQVVLALKTLCGFDVVEIAHRLFASEASVYKRLTRARKRLKELGLGRLESAEYSKRLPTVHKVVYLLFTEGYLSSHARQALRRELCEEAVRLTTLLAGDAVGQVPETYALLALMHLHLARMMAREDASGGLLLLEEQDRDLWDQRRIQVGLEWLAKSARGNRFSRYHAEAGIAAEHCLSASFRQTRWDKVVACYALLEAVAPSPLHRLNRAVAMAEWKGPEQGLAVLENLEPPTWLAGSYQWSAVLADLHRRAGNVDAADRYRKLAVESAPSEAIRNLLRRRLLADD